MTISGCPISTMSLVLNSEVVNSTLLTCVGSCLSLRASTFATYFALVDIVSLRSWWQGVMVGCPVGGEAAVGKPSCKVEHVFHNLVDVLHDAVFHLPFELGHRVVRSIERDPHGLAVGEQPKK